MLDNKLLNLARHLVNNYVGEFDLKLFRDDLEGEDWYYAHEQLVAETLYYKCDKCILKSALKEWEEKSEDVWNLYI